MGRTGWCLPRSSATGAPRLRCRNRAPARTRRRSSARPRPRHRTRPFFRRAPGGWPSSAAPPAHAAPCGGRPARGSGTPAPALPAHAARRHRRRHHSSSQAGSRHPTAAHLSRRPRRQSAGAAVRVAGRRRAGGPSSCHCSRARARRQGTLARCPPAHARPTVAGPPTPRLGCCPAPRRATPGSRGCPWCASALLWPGAIHRTRPALATQRPTPARSYAPPGTSHARPSPATTSPAQKVQRTSGCLPLQLPQRRAEPRPELLHQRRLGQRRQGRHRRGRWLERRCLSGVAAAGSCPASPLRPMRAAGARTARHARPLEGSRAFWDGCIVGHSSVGVCFLRPSANSTKRPGRAHT